MVEHHDEFVQSKDHLLHNDRDYAIEMAFFLSFLLFWDDTRSLRMPVLRPASHAGPMRNPMEGTSVVCSCCATSP